MAVDMIVIPYDRIIHGNREYINKFVPLPFSDPKEHLWVLEKKQDRIFQGKWPFNAFGKALDDLMLQKEGVALSDKEVERVDDWDLAIRRTYVLLGKNGQRPECIGKLCYSVTLEMPYYEHWRRLGHFSPSEITWSDTEPYFTGTTLLDKFRTYANPWETVDIDLPSIPAKVEIFREPNQPNPFSISMYHPEDNKRLPKGFRDHVISHGCQKNTYDLNQAISFVDRAISYVLKK